MRDLKEPTNANGLRFAIQGIGVSAIIYILTGFVCTYMFGVLTQGNVLLNFDGITNGFSYTLRVCFTVVICVHTPFVLFVGKESLLAIIG